MNNKVLSLAIMLSLMTTGVWAADNTAKVDKKLANYQAQAVVLAHQSVGQHMAENQAFPSAISITVDRAVEIALENNRNIKSAEDAYDAAKAQVGLAAASKNPQITYGYTAKHQDGSGVSSNVAAAAMARAKGGSADLVSNSYGHTVGVTMPIYTGGKAEGAIEAARYGREAAGAKVVQVEGETKLAATTNYYTLVMARNKADIAGQAVRDYEGHKKNVDLQYKVGIVAKSDVLATETALANAQTNLVQAKNGADLAESLLNNTLGLPVNTKIETADREMGYKPYNITMEQAKAYAALHRSELIQSVMGVKAAEAAVEIAKAGYRPTVGVSATKNWMGNTVSGTADQTWGFGASVSMNLWDGGQTENTIKMKKAALEQAKETNAIAYDGIMLEVSKAYLNMKAAEQTIASTKTALSQGQENFRIATVRYRAGVGTNLDVLDAETSLELSRNNYVDALYNYNTSVAALEKAMGIPVPTPVAGGEPIVQNSNAVQELDQLVTNANKGTHK